MDELKAKRYAKIKIFISILNSCLTVGILSWMIFSGYTNQLKEFALGFSEFWQISFFMYFLLFSMIFFIVDFPIYFYSGYVLEHQNHLSNQSVTDWFSDQFKKQGLSFVLCYVLLLGLYALIGTFQTYWWVVAWCLWLLLTVVFGQLWPVMVLPLFYKTTDIEDDSLKKRIKSFAEQHGMKVENIFALNLSKTTKKANACFCGLGPTKRILLGDTLLESFTPNEIESVLAHELGHFRYKHLLKGFILNSLVSFVLFRLLYQVMLALVPALGYTGMNDMATLPLICLVGFVFGFVLLPLQNAISRRMENQADDYAVDAQGQSDDFLSTMKKLATLNLADPSPHPFVEFFFYSHPSIAKRMDRQIRRANA